MGLQRVKQDSVTEQQQFSLIMLVIQMNKLAIEAVFYQDMIKVIYTKNARTTNRSHTFWIILVPYHLVYLSLAHGTLWELLQNKSQQPYKGKIGLQEMILTKVIVVVVIQSRSRGQLFATPWTAACQAPLSFTISWSYYCMILTMLWPNPSWLPPWLMNNIHIISFLKFEVTIPLWRIYRCLWPP